MARKNYIFTIIKKIQKSYQYILIQILENLMKNSLEQNVAVDFSASHHNYNGQIRFLSKSLLERTLFNGEKRLPWLIYSEITGEVRCGPCLAFESGTQFGEEGFNDWKNSFEHVEKHALS